jgi:hypothetical protein
MGKKLEKFKKKLLKKIKDIAYDLEPVMSVDNDVTIIKPKRVPKKLTKEEISKLVESVYNKL